MGNLSALLCDPSLEQTASEVVFSKARVIRGLGNRAGLAIGLTALASALIAPWLAQWVIGLPG